MDILYGLLYSGVFIYICDTIWSAWSHYEKLEQVPLIDTLSLSSNNFDSRNKTYICHNTNTFIKKSYKYEYETLIKLKDIDEVINVINPYICINEDECYIPMPYLKNWVILSEYNSNRRILIELFIKICRGLEKIHNTGVIHCDIKPDNIMVSPNEDIVFIDFEPTGGTSGYIAPEIIYDKYDESIYTTAVDIWSLGMTMLNVYIEDVNNELYKLTGLCNNTKKSQIIEMERNINILINHSTSDTIDAKMADLFVKILCIEPDKRIGLSIIIDELNMIYT